ncbi:MAG: adenine phosphoribosyltransferase [Planctomycetes bacterium]|nr:adenine phosphoribosyltransferase [Planctomycetota bacterium]MCC7170947.1 adenine phosphoribosyltransferase [Planctomycetota bacterium]
MDELKKLIRDIPDFPKKGILFKDVTPLLGSADGLRLTIRKLAEIIAGKQVTKVVGIESRGFIFGTALAHEMGLGFVPVRKPGKLPYQTVRESYSLEYGTDAIEMHRDAVAPGERVVIVDDLLATGGTMAAAAKLVRAVGGDPLAGLVVIELKSLNGRDKLRGLDVHALLQY